MFKATWETIYMVFISGFISIIFGLVLGSFLFVTRKTSHKAVAWLHRSLEFSVNVTRSMPYIILMIALIPFTRLLIGTTIGTNAAIIPLTIAAIPFFARICENALAQVPYGLIEAANAMGASTWHIVTKVLLPESLPALIRGATLTVIGLIGYSAMAGVVGGGGLGELAINYGYQRFDTVVMLETVVLLIVLVQLVQMAGDGLAKKRRIKTIVFASVLLWISCVGYQFWPGQLEQGNTIRVGIINGWQQDVMETARQVASKEYGLNLEIVPFSDYVQPNVALNNNSIDANIFQHHPYLQAQINAHHYPLKAIAKTFVYPMGFYSQKIQRISQLNDGAIIAIPNDPSNGSRALLILEKSGLIKLKSGAGTLASVNDIIANQHHLQFRLLDAAQLPRALKDVDLAAITNDFVVSARLTIKQALLKEDSESPYANLIVVREKDQEKPLIQKLVAIMHSQAVIRATEKIFPDGAAVAAWGGESPGHAQPH